MDFTLENYECETGTGLVLIDFSARWCPPCRLQAPIIERVAEQMAGKAKIGTCDVDRQRELALAVRIRHIPTILILKDGKEVCRLVGLQSEARVIASLEEFLD